MPKQPTQRSLMEAERKLNSSSHPSTSLSPCRSTRVFKSSPVWLFCHFWPGVELGLVSETPSDQFFFGLDCSLWSSHCSDDETGLRMTSLDQSSELKLSQIDIYHRKIITQNH